MFLGDLGADAGDVFVVDDVGGELVANGAGVGGLEGLEGVFEIFEETNDRKTLQMSTKNPPTWIPHLFLRYRAGQLQLNFFTPRCLFQEVSEKIRP